MINYELYYVYGKLIISEFWFSAEVQRISNSKANEVKLSELNSFQARNDTAVRKYTIDKIERQRVNLT